MLIEEKKRRILNIVLCMVAIAIMVFYSFCTGSCRYLKGNIFGFDLKYVGILYMLVLIGANLLRKNLINAVFLAIGVGGEIFLIAFQVREGRYCPYCMIFGIIVIAQFIINLKWSWMPVLAVAIVAGFFFFFFFFHGSLLPTYDFGVVKELLDAVPWYA